MGALEDYRDRRSRRRPAWAPPALEDFQAGHVVLSFDQSLAATGWVRLAVGPLGVQVLDRGMLRTRTDLASFSGSFDRATQLKDALVAAHAVICGEQGFPDDIVVETPPVGGHRPESSLLAAFVLHTYCYQWWSVPKLVSIQHSRSVLGGPEARNHKQRGHAALVRYVPQSATRQWNEHQRDAALNGLAHLYDLRTSAIGEGA